MRDTNKLRGSTINISLSGKISVLSIFLLAWISLPVFSQERAKDTVAIDEIVVTGTPDRVNKNMIPMAVTIVRQDAIANSGETSVLPALNGRVPGLFVTERGVTGFGVSAGAAGQITIRGVGGNPTTGVLMLIDGHPQFQGIFGHPLADSYVTSDVSRVEVIRGPASILYGSNAMGGVINLITNKQYALGWHGNADLAIESYHTQKYMASGGYNHNKISVFASVNHDQTEGHRPNADFNITNGYCKLGYALASNLKASADFSIARFHASDPGPDTTGASPGRKIDITRGYTAFTLEQNGEKFTGSARLFYNFGEHQISDGFHSTDADYGLKLIETAKLFPGNRISIGVDYDRYGGMAENENTVVFKDTMIHDLGIYSLIQQTLFDKLTIDAGIRLQDHSVYGKVWVPAAGFAFRFTPTLTWKGSVSKGFRSPTLQELFIWNHNPYLLPEKVMSYESGILTSLSDNRLTVEFTAYYLNGTNMIINVPMEGLRNAGEVKNKGIELAISAKPAANLEMNLSYSYIDMKKPVYATPRNQLFTECNYLWNKFRFNINADWVEHLDTDPSSGEHFQTYWLVNARLTYQLFRFASVYAGAENLLNEKYETILYYPMPGITALAGLRFRF